MDAAARAALQRSKAAQESELHPNDILKAMAACLVEDNSAVYQIAHIPDREPPVLETIKKPPKEIFYRKTQLFATKIPDEVGPKRCTCQYLCTGAAATIKCLSCVLYDPKGLGFFCKMCFDARHPWYRVPHIFNDIETDESVQHTLKVSHRRAEMVRYERESHEQLKLLRENIPKLKYIADDIKVSNGLQSAGTRSVALEKHIREYRKVLRADILKMPLSTPCSLPLSDEEAAIIIAKWYRGFKTRHILSLFVMNRIVKGHDHNSNREFFYDKVTKKSSWKKPLLLLDVHVNSMTSRSTIEKELKAKAEAEAEAERQYQLELARLEEESSINSSEMSEERGRKRDPYNVKGIRSSSRKKSKSKSPNSKSGSRSRSPDKKDGKNQKKEPYVSKAPAGSGRRSRK